MDVVTTDAAILAGYEAKYPKEFTHWDLGLDSTEAWGVNVGDNQALKTLVELTLYRSWKDPHDERWELAYQTNLQSEIAAQGGTPIAAAEQPAVPRPHVRELPWEDGREMSDVFVKVAGVGPRRRRAQLNWVFTVLPAFPLVLLVLRLWYLSRQDLPTMLLLVQYISPLGMISALFITLIWTVPAVILVMRVLGGILLVSAPGQAGRSQLAVNALRMPDWVVLLAVVLASFSWQLRMLPVLAMMVVSILGLTAVQRYPGREVADGVGHAGRADPGRAARRNLRRAGRHRCRTGR